MKALTRLAFAAIVASISFGVASADVDKKTCKGHASSVVQITRELGVTTSDLGSSGRSLLDQVQRWIGEHDSAEVDALAARVETALAGVKECESNGFFAQVTKVKPDARTLKGAVLPWLRNAAQLDPCQDTITEAIKKRENDADGAIADLLRAIDECRGETWIREARRQLAEVYFLRGDVSRNDYAAGREQVGLTLATCGELEPEQRTTVTAILARAMIEAGKQLMDGGAYGEAVLHWQDYIARFGTADFEPLFASRQVADGAYELRSLRDANFQWALACLEGNDPACLTARVEEFDQADATDALEALVARSFALVGDGDDAYVRVAFDLMNHWHEIEPGAYAIKRMLQNELLDRPAAERMDLLRRTTHCWIPTELAGMLRQEGREFVDEATLAAQCGGGDGKAAAMLAAVEVERARRLLDRVVLASSAGERKSLESELEGVLASIGDTAATREIREGLAAERKRQAVQVVNSVDNSAEIYADCTTILATIQWNESREDDYSAELRNFKTGCCAYLRKNRSGWTRHLKSILEQDQVTAKLRLLDRYCGG